MACALNTVPATEIFVSDENVDFGAGTFYPGPRPFF